MAGIATRTGFYVPNDQEEDYRAAILAGYIEHESFDNHFDPSKPQSPRIWIDPVDGEDLLSGSRPDLAKATVQSAVTVAGVNGADIEVLSSGRKDRTDGVPHIDLGATPIVINAQRHIRLFCGTSDVDGHGGETGGHSMCWIRGAVPNDGLIQVRTGARFEMHGGTLENTAAGGWGMTTRQVVGMTLRKVEAINCAGGGFRHRTSASDSSAMESCVATGCGYGLLLESTPPSDVAEYALNNQAAPNAFTVKQGQYERCSKNCIAAIADTGAGGLRGLRFEGVKLQHPPNTNWDGTYADRALFLGRGISSADLIGFYNEADTDGAGTIDVPMFRFKEARGGSIADESDWNGPIRIRGGEWTYMPDMSTWTTIGVSPTGAVGAHIFAAATRGLSVKGVNHKGLNSNTRLSTDHPLARLTASCKVSELHLRNVGGAGNRPDAVGKVISNAGTGNFGTWMDPATDTGKLWGTQPS